MHIDWNSIPQNSKEKISIEIEPNKNLDIIVIKGKESGKTLVLCAGVHGCEYVGIQAMKKFSNSLAPEDIKGMVILLPLLNPNGFLQVQRQVMPEDGKNLNSVFPGTSYGTYSEKLAAIIEEEIYPVADFLLDLHGGDINEELVPLIFYPAEANPSITQEALSAAKQLSLPLLVASTAKNGLYSWAAQKEIPALLLERGCLGRWTDVEVEEDISDVTRLMIHLGIKSGINQIISQREITEAIYEKAVEDGFWYPYISAGDHVKKGQILGELFDMYGNKVQSYCAEWDGVVMYYTVSLGVMKNESLVAYGRY